MKNPIEQAIQRIEAMASDTKYDPATTNGLLKALGILRDELHGTAMVDVSKFYDCPHKRVSICGCEDTRYSCDVKYVGMGEKHLGFDYLVCPGLGKPGCPAYIL